MASRPTPTTLTYTSPIAARVAAEAAREDAEAPPRRLPLLLLFQRSAAVVI